MTSSPSNLFALFLQRLFMFILFVHTYHPDITSPRLLDLDEFLTLAPPLIITPPKPTPQVYTKT